LLSHFGREAKILASINSPNIASIHGYEESKGVHLLVLELVDGPTLRERLRQGPLPLNETLTALGSVAAALKSAHDLGIIHCDLKPENVKITPEGVVKVLDFGIAKRAVRSSHRGSQPAIIAAIRDRTIDSRRALPEGETDAMTLVEHSTDSGLAGTPPYMSPEQVTKERIDNRTDNWAFGCLLFECLAGKSPFARRTVPETLMGIVGTEPDWTLLPSTTPQRLRDLLQRCLDKDPDTRIADILDAQIQMQACALEIGSEPVTVAELPKHNLPARRSRFVGRTRETRQIASVLAATRLVTLVGGGGSGTTRLATEMGLQLLAEFRDGVWLVESGPGVDSHSLPRMVAQGLGLSAQTAGDLVQLLRPKNLLLVLDGCEQDPTAWADLVSQLLSDCPSLSILATGMTALGVAGEAAYHVLPLELPEPSAPPPLEDLARVGAVMLFADCARSMRADFTLSEETAPAVVEICRMVSGIPLAIELVAARLSSLSTEHLAQRLSKELDAPTQQRPTSREHARAIRATVEWVCQQLSDAERTVMRRLTVFAGGWTMEAANAVCGGDGIDDVLDPLTRLVDASLVFVESRGGQVRYRMADAIWGCAHVQLTESSDCTAVHRRHCDFFMELAERAEPKLAGPERAAWATRLEADHANLRAALEWAEDAEGETELSDQLGTAQHEILLRRLAVFEGSWTVGAAEGVCRGNGVEGVARLIEELTERSLVVRMERHDELRFEMSARVRHHARKRLLEAGEGPEVEHRHRAFYLGLAEEGEVGLAGPDQPMWLRRLEADHANLQAAAGSYLQRDEASASLRFVVALSRFWDIHGHLQEGQRLTLQALDMVGAGADPVLRARALSGAAQLALRQGDLPKADTQLDEAHRLLKAASQRDGVASVLDTQASVAVRRGDFERARSLCEQSLKLHREQGDKQGVAWSLLTLGEVAYRKGNYNGSRELREKSLVLFRETDDKYGLAWALTNVGKIAGRLGDHAAARACHEESLAIHRELGDKAGIAWSLSSLAHVIFAWGDLYAARALLEEGLVLSKQVGNLNGTAWSLCHLGGLAYYEGDLRGSASLLVESLALFRHLDADVGSAWCLNGMGNVARRGGKLRRSSTLLSASLSLFTRLGETRGIASALRAFSLLAAASGNATRAVQLLAAAEAQRETTGETLAPPEQQEIDERAVGLRRLLGEAAFLSAQEQGRALNLEEAVSLALSRPNTSIHGRGGANPLGVRGPGELIGRRDDNFEH
jgi:predicted ATPase